MARVPEIIRRNNISRDAPVVQETGAAWTALGEIAAIGADFLKPAAMEQAREEGINAVYRDESGQLKVDKISPMGGPLADAYNTAAYAKYLSQRSIQMGETFTELGIKYQFDPAGFKEAADNYVRSIRSEKGVPPVLQEEIAGRAEQEAGQRFNGLTRESVKRDQQDAEKSTRVQRDMVADDYINLLMEGDTEAAEKKYNELVSISKFRGSAPYISETPEETEAYLRGIRGAAKAASMSRRLSDLTGATSIPDDLRKELDEFLKDPDLDPKRRAELYRATKGMLKGMDAHAIVNGLTDGSYEGRVVAAESSGRSDAKNDGSSATGIVQFTSGTWLGLVRKYVPDWARGKSEAELLEYRKDPAKSLEMLKHFRAENQAVLRGAGLPINNATEYLAHFLGAGSAVKVLSADPTAALKDILPESTIKANPFLEDMTVAGVQNWAARKMTMKASDIAAQQATLNAIPDTELRAMAFDALGDQIGMREESEAAAYREYKERLNLKDGLTEDEILADHDLSDYDQGRLVKELQTNNKKATELQNTVARLQDPNTTFDRFDTKDKTAVSDVFEATTDGADPLSDPKHVATAAGLAERTGILPKGMFNALRSAVHAVDPARVALALESAAQLEAASPGSLSAHDGSSAVTKALSDYKRLAEFMSPEEAASAIIERREKPAKNVTDQMKKAVKDLKVSDVVNALDESPFWDPTIGVKGDHGVNELTTAYLKNEMLVEYTTMFEKEFLETGDAEISKGRAVDQMLRIYGVNQVTGDGRVMKFPPQNFYPPVGGSWKWMTREVEREVSEFVYGKDALSLEGYHSMPANDAVGKSPKWVSSRQIKLVSDQQTREEATTGKPPSYVVYYMKGEKLELLPKRYSFDPKNAQSEAQADFERRRREAMTVHMEEAEVRERGQDLQDWATENAAKTDEFMKQFEQ